MGLLAMLGGAVSETSTDSEGAVAAAAFMVAISALVVLSTVVIVRFGADWTLTRDRLVQRVGIISRTTSEIELGDVRNVQVRQGVIDQVLGIGSVLVPTAGQSGFEIVVTGIAVPARFADVVRRRRHPETETRRTPPDPDPPVYEIP